MSNWDMCFYCKINVCSLEECPSRDRTRYKMPSGKPEKARTFHQEAEKRETVMGSNPSRFNGRNNPVK